MSKMITKARFKNKTGEYIFINGTYGNHIVGLFNLDSSGIQDNYMLALSKYKHQSFITIDEALEVAKELLVVNNVKQQKIMYKGEQIHAS